MFPYVENHNFYIEHWSLSLFWRRVRELGQVLADAGFWAEADDIFLLRRDEVPQAIFDYGNGWAVGAECAGPYHWPARDRAPPAASSPRWRPSRRCRR